MKKTTLRLGVALTGSVSALAFASPAFANCDLTTPDTYTCVATTTTDTTLAVTPSVDRHAVLTVGAVTTPVQVVINGAVDGYGLAFTQGDTATNGIVVTNSGSIAVNAGNTATAGGNNGALAIVSNGTPVSYSGAGTISNLGIGDALQINASGSAVAVPITVNAGGLITSANGNGATLNAASTGSTINATFNGINAGSVGIAAQTTNGALTLNTGAIQAAGAGVTANSTTGTITTNVTGNVTSTGAPAAALLLTSTSGPINVNVTGGNVTNATSTAISADTAALATVNVAAGRTVSGATAIAAPNAAGSLTVVNNGTLTGTTAAVNSAAVTNLTNSTTGVINGGLILSAFNDIVTNNGTLSLSGTSDFGLGADRLTNNGTATLAGTVGFGGGDDTLVNTAGHTLTISGTTDLGAGLDTVTNAGTLNVTGSLLAGDNADSVVNQGTMTVASGATVDLGLGDDTLNNTGTLTVTGTLLGGDGNDTLINATGATTTIAGTANLGLGNDTITNAGTFNVTGTLNTGDGNDTLNNSGTYSISGTQDFGIGTDAVNNTGTFNVTGTGNLANLETFSNSAAGVVNFASGSSLTAGAATTFTNSGRFNAEAGPVNIVTPTFTNAATGIIDMQDGANGDVTTITGNYVGTAGSRVVIDANADLTASDRLVVTGNISGTSTLAVAYLGTAATFNPTGALVVDGAGTTAAGSFVLDPASVNNGLLTYALDQRGSDYYLSSNFNAGVTGLAPLARMGSDMWYQSFDAYHDGIAGRHGVRQNNNTPFGVWGNMYWSRDKWGDVAATSTLFGQNLSYSSEVENHRRGAQGGVDIGFGGFTVGITGGYEHNKANNGTFADYDVEGYNYGAYALFGSEAGIYGGVMYKRDNYDVRYSDNVRGFQQEFNNAHSDGWDGELGFRTGGETVKFDLNAGLSWVKTKIDPVTLYGSTFSYDDAESMRGRLGARIILPQTLGAFVGVKAFHEFKKDNEALFITSGTTTGALLPDPRGTTIRVEGGLGGDAKGGPLLTVWGDFGDSKGLGVRAGFRF
ncbi:autotransporter outer membrane beta-barrel domain-containing protein [Novosphingobium aquiterrae]|uniref:Autotransporter outer membrane beta-barrel domain-containing protein n=2 Tax=Novosphingobium aquiterrae TaxID=624388 RepID=A0ABV6PK38_9SPHN